MIGQQLPAAGEMTFPFISRTFTRRWLHGKAHSIRRGGLGDWQAERRLRRRGAFRRGAWQERCPVLEVVKKKSGGS